MEKPNQKENWRLIAKNQFQTFRAMKMSQERMTLPYTDF